jgi:hypothetical protein
MTYEFLPEPEPGEPSLLPPGFTDSVMQRIADYERAQRHRRMLVSFVIAVCVAIGYLLGH